MPLRPEDCRGRRDHEVAGTEEAKQPAREVGERAKAREEIVDPPFSLDSPLLGEPLPRILEELCDFGGAVMPLGEDTPVRFRAGGAPSRLRTIEGSRFAGDIRREVEDSPGPENAEDLSQGAPVAVARDVLDHRDRESMLERLIRERELARVTDVERQRGINVLPPVDLEIEAIDGVPMALPFALKKAWEELRTRDVEARARKELLGDPTHLPEAPGIEGHEKAVEPDPGPFPARERAPHEPPHPEDVTAPDEPAPAVTGQLVSSLFATRRR